MPEDSVAILPAETIRAKRDGLDLDDGAIQAFVGGIVDGSVSGEQAAAFAMATFFRGMTRRESTALTLAMTRSGTVLDWHDQGLSGPVLDKHSTGGVGDDVSLILAPALAACGAFVPMISGRGLGHSGGTLDKLEAIPGYRVSVGIPDLRAVVREVGCAIVGATADLAPADARLYAIRDVTATVESVPLITGSILSKKMAAGLDGLVMDVKTGSGAFMARREDARDLARTLVEVACAAGLPTTALVTDMDEPLASAAGNGLEVRHAIDHLTGAAREPRVAAVTVALGGALLALGGLARDAAEGERMIEAAIATGAAAERFAAMVRALGGPGDLVDNPDRHLAAAPVRRLVPAKQVGFVTAIDTRRIGLAVVTLGGGRIRPGEAIDPRVGCSGLAPVGAAVGPGRALGTVHAATEAAADLAAAALEASYRVGDHPRPSTSPILDRIAGGP